MTAYDFVMTNQNGKRFLRSNDKSLNFLIGPITHRIAWKTGGRWHAASSCSRGRWRSIRPRRRRYGGRRWGRASRRPPAAPGSRWGRPPRPPEVIAMYAVLRIRDVYPGPGSWFLPIPDPGSRIQNQQQKRGVKKICCHIFFCSQQISPNWKLLYFLNAEEQNLDQFSKNFWTFYPKICY